MAASQISGDVFDHCNFRRGEPPKLRSISPVSASGQSPARWKGPRDIGSPPTLPPSLCPSSLYPFLLPSPSPPHFLPLSLFLFLPFLPSFPVKVDFYMYEYRKTVYKEKPGGHQRLCFTASCAESPAQEALFHSVWCKPHVQPHALREADSASGGVSGRRDVLFGAGIWTTTCRRVVLEVEVVMC